LQATREAPCPPPVSVGELARQYLAVRRDDRRPRERRRYERLVERVRANPAQAGPLDWLLRGIGYKNEPAAVGNYRRPTAGPSEVVWDSSPSEVEKYLQCPFKHFAAYGLRLDAARGPRPLRWDLGDVGHAVLADVTQRGMREPGGVRAVADARWQDLLDEAVQAFWSQRPAEYAERRPDLVFMGGVLRGFLSDVIAVHAARWRRGGFDPLHCEQDFNPRGAGDALRGVELALGDGRRVHLHGKIDRVDVCRQDDRTFLLVYDYKSGGVQNIRANFLTGSRLQLFLYLLALRQNAVDDSATVPAGVFLAPLYPDLDVLKNKFAAEADPREQTMYLYRPRGLISETAARLLDSELGTLTSPVAHLQLKKDGGFYAKSDALPSDGIEQRMELAAQTVLFAADGVVAGHINVAPLVENHQLACRNCEFQAVCRYDPAYNAARPAESVLPRLATSASEGEDAP
jgi:ATP-dependent helicase/nuclease subunit B